MKKKSFKFVNENGYMFRPQQIETLCWAVLVLKGFYGANEKMKKFIIHNPALIVTSDTIKIHFVFHNFVGIFFWYYGISTIVSAMIMIGLMRSQIQDLTPPMKAGRKKVSSMVGEHNNCGLLLFFFESFKNM